MKLRRQYQRALDAFPWPRLGAVTVTVFWGCGLALTELLGRASPNDGVDLALLLFLLLGTAGLHSNAPIAPVSWFFRAIVRGYRWMIDPSLEIGIDFRQNKPTPSAIPRELTRLTTALIVGNVALLPLLAYFPAGFRSVVQPWFYLGYLAVVGTIWLSLLYLSLVLVIFGWASIHDWFTMRHRLPTHRKRWPERLIVIGIYTFVFALAMILPTWFPLLLAVLSLVVMMVTFSLAGRDFQMLWTRGEKSVVWSFDGRVYLGVVSGAVILATTFLMLVSQGQRIVGGDSAAISSQTPVMAGMGWAFSWMAIPGLLTFAGTAIRFSLLGVRFNPERDDLKYHARYEGDHRRWEIEQRRHLVRGLKGLFKRKARLTTNAGTGVWIGLQHWYIVGMTRDTAEDDDETTVLEHIIGPPYHRIFSPETRLHFWEICRAVEVDLILVEDGVSFRRFVRVLRAMFETYDVYGGRQRCEELHFAGLPGVRVVLHEFDLADNNELQLTNYPEPDYDELARARILHVFKDRGDDEVEPDWIPDDWEDVPVLMGM